VQLVDGSETSIWCASARQRFRAPNLKALLADPDRLKLYHFARFDVAIMRPISASWRRHSIAPAPLRGWCGPIPTAMASRSWSRNCSAPTFSKQQQTSDWGAAEISDAQREYAASDVRYLHRLKEQLDDRLARENRVDLARPVSTSFLLGHCSTSPAGPRPTSFAHDG
jgi:ribonuclease D